MTKRFHLPIRWIVTVLILAGVAAYVATHLQIETIEREATNATAAMNPPGAEKVNPGPEELPNEANFKVVGENERLRLKLDAKTAQFLVEDKKDGRIWRSYPNPSQWANETTSSALWRSHLRSPIMFQYIDLTGNKSQPKESNLLDQQGAIKDLQTFEGGFRVTFEMPSAQLTIPVEVKLEKDSVTTRIIDSGMKEGSLSLLSVRLYPFFGAERSEGQDGYMLIPDGSGALIQYDPNSTNVNRIYRESVYGDDIAFKIGAFDNPRRSIKMPIYGAKSENRSFLAVLEDGAEFAEIIASPSGVFSTYNWVTSQANYRASYKQVTNREKKRSFITYNKKERFHTDRVTRYILLENTKSDYTGMAERYRQYLMDTYNMQRLKPKNTAKVPMDIVILGADSAKGLISDRYVKATTTSEAMQMVQRLNGLGIDNMTVRYWGWQEDGFGESGGLAHVDSRLGGDGGMKEFIKFAHLFDIPVYLRSEYLFNTTGAGGFSQKVHGLRDLGGTPLGDRVSLKFTLQNIVDKDIAYFKGLGVDGVEIHGIGQGVHSDFNDKYGSPRDESRAISQSILSKFREGVGKVMTYKTSIYAAPYSDSIDALSDDYSYDLFTNAGIPFAQIALHGLLPYTASPSNERNQFRQEFLHDLEYGANPSYLFTSSASEDLKYIQNLFLYSPAYQDWEQTAVQEYQKWNEALGDVQDQFIVGHRILTDQVRETTYANGKTIVVNYGDTPYTYGDKTVKSEDYLIVKGSVKQ
ncbi:MAG: hypothetical protein K0Q73_2478 [Paenibacillus sp.]|jgi:hypothetical protein|nr:hypothetical protein [Paenibacillus sp.]